MQRRVRCKGVYTTEMRAVMRLLTMSGCVPAKLGKVMQTVMRFCGFNVKCSASRRTVQRAILEGGVAAKVQMGYEILKTEG